jgi:hypothetical protein
MFASSTLTRRVYIRQLGRGFFVNVTAGRTVYRSAERPEASGWGVATLLREIIAKGVKARGGKGRDLTRRMLYLPALIVAAVLMACAVVVLALSEKAEATFPGKNGRIAYSVFGERTDDAIYTIGPDGGAKTKLTRGYQPSYSPDGKRLAYTVSGGNSARDALSETSQGFQPSSGKGPAYNASEKLQKTKTASGARVTLNWVYAEENYVSIGYQVEDLKDLQA